MPSSLYNPAPLFIQAMLAQPSMSFEKAMSLHHRCLEACYELDSENHDRPPRQPDPAAFQRFRESVNERLEPVGLEIRDTNLQEYRTRQIDGKTVHENVKWVALINTVSDPLALAATSYSALEINYLKIIIDAVITSPRFAYSISTLTATRLAEELKKGRATQALSNKQRETLLERFTGVDGEGWLERSQRGRYSLSPRTLMELEDYLKKTYAPEQEDDDEDADPPVLLLCELERCRKLVTLGHLCPNCSAHGLHGSCMIAALRRPDARCPCGQDWNEDTEWFDIGEKAVRDGEDEQRGKKRMVRDSDSEEEEDENGASSSRNQTRRSSTISSASRAPASSRKKAAAPKKTRASASAAKNKKKKRVAGLGDVSDDDDGAEDQLQEEDEQEDDEEAEEEVDELATPAPSQAPASRRRPARREQAQEEEDEQEMSED